MGGREWGGTVCVFLLDSDVPLRVFTPTHLYALTVSMPVFFPPSPPASLLTQIKSVVSVDLYPKLIHLCVPLGVRVPQHLAVHIHYFLALALCILRHACHVRFFRCQHR